MITEVGRNAEVLARTLEEVATQGNEKILESLLKLTNIGYNLPRIFQEAANPCFPGPTHSVPLHSGGTRPFSYESVLEGEQGGYMSISLPLPFLIS